MAWQDALRAFRRRSFESVEATSDVMFVLCSEHHAAAALVSACAPAMTLQLPGGAASPSDPSVFAAFEHGVKLACVRRVVVCGHAGCHLMSAVHGPEARRASPADVAAQCRRLRDDPRIGALLRTHGVALHAIWLDDDEGDVHRCDFEGVRAPLMNDDEVASVLVGRPEARPQ